MTKYVGIDVHKQACHATVMDEYGNILKQEKFPNETFGARKEKLYDSSVWWRSAQPPFGEIL